MNINTGTEDFIKCPECGKPYYYTGDVPEGGFAKGLAPYCTGHEEEKNKQQHYTLYGWICPKCGAGLSPYVSTCPFCSPKMEITYSLIKS